MVHSYSISIGDRDIYVEHGRMARQAHGAVTVRCGDAIVFVSACMSDKESHLPFFPLTVEYREKGYAAGKIPGSIFKREARPSEHETLSARLIDHQIRPLFPKDFKNEVQVVVNILSHDQENGLDVLACIGASLALSISKIPFNGPYGAVRVGRSAEGDKIVLPTYQELEVSDIDMIVAGNADTVSNIEGTAREIPEDEMLDLMAFGHEYIKQLTEFQLKVVEEIGQPKFEFVVPEVDEALVAKVEETAAARVDANLRIVDKTERSDDEHALRAEVVEALSADTPEEEKDELAKAINGNIKTMLKERMRKRILDEGIRIDGRKIDEIRDITCEIGLLPRAHGSSLFTRGQTQALGSVTLGTKMDERLVDNLEGKSFKNYMLDYNFPPFSVGEVRRMVSTSRREIGHGHLAETAIEPVIPGSDSFPYTVRIVSDIMESNGSSSMASVCAASLALMDAGVPIKSAVAGMNCGLITDGERQAVLSDLIGLEDANGDMDLKISGTAEGVTSFQMDIKVGGIPMETMREAFMRAREGRLHILGIMGEAIEKPRENLSRFAPRILTIKIDTSQIGMIIGPGGKNIRELEEVTGATIEIQDDGTINVSSLDGASGEAAIKRIQGIVKVPEVGESYEGLVKSIQPYGAFIEILPGKDGFLHISEMTEERLDRVEDAMNVGDTVKVNVVAVDDRGKVRLSCIHTEDTGGGRSGGGGGGRSRRD